MTQLPNSRQPLSTVARSTEATGSGPGLLVAYAPFALWSPHFETDLEIIQGHLETGGEVLVLSCGARLRTCEPNPTHRRIDCMACQGRLASGLEWLSPRHAVRHENFYDLTVDEERFIEQLRIRQWADADEVRNFRIDGADIGLSALSSVISVTREPSPDVGALGPTLGDNLASAATVFFSLRRKLSSQAVAKFVVFNGRLAALRPALRAAQQLGIPAIVHERAGYTHRYIATPDTYPHDLAAIKQDIATACELGMQSAEPEASAHSWYAERRAGVAQNWYSFTRDQAAARLPEGFDPALRNLAVFVSSEDEFVAIEEWRNPLYDTQNDALGDLLERFGHDPRCRIYVRMHPNLKGVDNSQTRELKRLDREFPSAVVIPADSAVSSYGLVDAAGLVVSFGSTIGIEACHAGKASVLVGRAMYEDLGVCLRPGSPAEFLDLVGAFVAGREFAPPEGAARGLVEFGLYNRFGGHAYRFMRARGLFDARMVRDGVASAIRPGLALRAVRAVERGLASATTKVRTLSSALAARVPSAAPEKQ